MKLFRLLLALFVFILLTTLAMILVTQNFSCKPSANAIAIKTPSALANAEIGTMLRVLRPGTANRTGTNTGFINTGSSKSNVPVIATGSSKSSTAITTTEPSKSNPSLLTETNDTTVAESNHTSSIHGTPRPLRCRGCFLTNFSVLIENPHLCAPSNGAVPEMIIIITTSLKGYDYRQAIRETWASVTKGNTAEVRHVFLLGRTDDRAVMASIREESSRYNDLVVTDFADTYDNLTYKTLSGLHWIVRRCGQVRFFLKTDQDMYILPHKLLALSKEYEQNLTTSIGGHCHRNHQPWREPGTRYYVPYRAYPQPNYPDFCSGTGYLGTLTLARTMVRKSVDVPFFYLEDIYMALVLSALRYDVTCFLGFVETPWKCYRGAGAVVRTIHDVSPRLMRSYWSRRLCDSGRL